MLAKAKNHDDGADALLFVERAKTLLEMLRERAPEAEARGRVHDETIASLLDAGFHRICQPRRFGGYELEPDTGIEAVMAVARGCGSAGWLTNVFFYHNWQVSMFPLEAQQEYWAHSRDVLCSTAGFAVRASIEPASGGVLLSGHWKFASGADFADWFMLMRQGEGSTSWMLVPRGAVSIVDNWDVSGLRATGSKDIILDGVFVPEHRMVSLADLETGRTTGAELYESPFYRVPFFAVAPLGLASAVVGMATGSVDVFQADMARKRAVPSGLLQSERPSNQILLGEASADLEAARLLLRRSMKRLRDWGMCGRALTEVERVEPGRNAAAAARAGVEIAVRLGIASGASATFNSHPMQRVVRDVLAGASHAGLQFDAAMEAYGRALWSPPSAAASMQAVRYVQ